MYLYELVNWLTTVIDSLALKDTYKEEAYSGAVSYIASCFLVRILFSLACLCDQQHRSPPPVLSTVPVSTVSETHALFRALFLLPPGLPHGSRYPDVERERDREPPSGRRLPRRGAQTQQPLPRRRLR